MAVVGTAGLQQVLSLSSVVEKVQQTSQHRPDLTQNNLASVLKLEDQAKRTEITPLNKSGESRLREEYTNKGGIKHKNRPRKRKYPDRKRREREDILSGGSIGKKIVDLIV